MRTTWFRVVAWVWLVVAMLMLSRAAAAQDPPRLDKDSFVPAKGCKAIPLRDETALGVALESGECDNAGKSVAFSLDRVVLASSMDVDDVLVEPALVWASGRSATRVWRALLAKDVPTACNFSDGAKNVGTCLVQVQAHDTIVGTIGGVPPATTKFVILTLSKNQQLKLPVRLGAQCRLAGRTRNLYAGAKQQTIELGEPSSICLAALAQIRGLRLSADSAAVPARFYPKEDQEPTRIELTDVPASLPKLDGASDDLQLLDSSGKIVLSSIDLVAQARPEVLPGAEIEYFPEEEEIGTHDQIQAARHRNAEYKALIAFVKQASGKSDYEAVAPSTQQLPVLAIDPVERTGHAVVNRVPVRLPDTTSTWTVTVGRPLQLQDDAGYWGDSQTFAPGIAQRTLIVRAPKTFVGAEMTASFETKGAKILVPLAARVSRFSIPLPARDILHIRCPGVFVDDGATRAIANSELAEGKCKVAVGWRDCPEGYTILEENQSVCRREADPAKKTIERDCEGQACASCPTGYRVATDTTCSRLPELDFETTERLPKVGERLSLLFGPQRFQATVSRPGATSTSTFHAVSRVLPSEGASDVTLFRLAAPGGDATGDGPYVVEIAPTGRGSGGAVAYRFGEDGKISKDAETADFAELRFSARLRPRGAFGWPCDDWVSGWAPCHRSVRTYVTVGIPVAGVRFPASERRLKSSSSPTDYQAVGPRLNVLATVEPWNYNTAENATMVGAAFQAGLGFVDLGSAEFELSTLVGASFLLPLVADKSFQLGTSLAIGAFWEKDLLVDSPAHGHHALLHLGLNVGSILSGAQKE